MALDRQDIQGLVISSYKHLLCSAYVLLRLEDKAKGRSWISQLTGEITTSEHKHPDHSTNLAFTSTGLKNLGLSESVLSTFSLPFQEGMATEHRSRILGDGDDNSPEKWDWGGKSGNQVDALLLIYGKDEAVLKAQLQLRQDQLASNGGFAEAKVLFAGRQPDNREHFGFHDGIGQPVMESSGNEERQKKRTRHATRVPDGEFLMGHPNVYGVTADGPVVAEADDPRQLLVAVPPDATGLNAKPNMHDLGRNGTYLVFRQLAQDVAKFWNFLDAATRDQNGASNPAARERLGAKFVGRWKSGAPLVMSPDKDDPELQDRNDFAYFAQDPEVYVVRLAPTSAALTHAIPWGLILPRR